MENSLGGGTQPPRSDKEKMIRGSAWMTAGSVFRGFLVLFMSFRGVFGLERLFNG